MRRAAKGGLFRLIQRGDEKLLSSHLHRPNFAIFVPADNGDLGVCEQRLVTRIEAEAALVALDNFGPAVDGAQSRTWFQPDSSRGAAQGAGQAREEGQG